MKILNEIDISNGSNPSYVVYFYHKFNKFVWKVITDGTKSPVSLKDELGINKDMKSSPRLPKYISDKL